jgi:hypothetical protein
MALDASCNPLEFVHQRAGGASSGFSSVVRDTPELLHPLGNYQWPLLIPFSGADSPL